MSDLPSLPYYILYNQDSTPTHPSQINYCYADDAYGVLLPKDQSDRVLVVEPDSTGFTAKSLSKDIAATGITTVDAPDGTGGAQIYIIETASLTNPVTSVDDSHSDVDASDIVASFISRNAEIRKVLFYPPVARDGPGGVQAP